jgi:hypothetical protein
MNDAGTEKIFNPHETLLALDHQPLDEVETLGTKLYSDMFLDTARGGCKPMHDGCEARFYPATFKHAFFKSPGDYEIDNRRVARIHWILPMIAGKLPQSECWELVQNGVEKRCYICFGLGYVVWFKLRLDGCWCFLTAYTAPAKRLRKLLKDGDAIRVARF